MIYNVKEYMNLAWNEALPTTTAKGLFGGARLDKR